MRRGSNTLAIPGGGHAGTAEHARSSSDLRRVVLAVFIAFTAARLGDVFPLLQPFRVGLMTQVASLGVLVLMLRGDLLRRIAGDFTVRSVVVIAALAVITIPTGSWPTASLEYLTSVHYVILLLFIATIVTFSDRQSRRYTLIGVLATVTVAAAKPILSGAVGRWGIGFTYDQNVTAALFVMMIPWAAAVVMTERGRLRWLALLSVPLLLIGIIKTGSRGGMLGLIALAPFLYGIAPPKRRAAFVAVVAFVSVIFATMYGEHYTRRFTRVLSKEDYNFEDKDGRIEVWKRGLSYVAGAPLTGVGINGFRYKELETKMRLYGGGKDSAAHNMYVEIAAELGIIGFLAFLAASFGSITAAQKRRKRSAAQFAATGDRAEAAEAVLAGAAIASLASLLVTGFFLSMAHSALIYFAWGAAAGIALTGAARPQFPAMPQLRVPAVGRFGAQRGWRSIASTQRSRRALPGEQ